MTKKFELLILSIYLSLVSGSSNEQHAGHLKQFGSSGPFDKIEEYSNGFPDPWTFFTEYLNRSRLVFFPKALINDSHLNLWQNDENLENIFDNDEQIVHVETRKKESRQQEILKMTMTDFLKRYQTEDLYLVEEVPQRLRSYFVLPKALQCDSAYRTFQVAMMWFSSGNTSSVVHTDDYDNINCVLQGEKYFVLIDPHKNPQVASEIIDHQIGAYSSIDVDRVDYRIYPSLNDESVHYYQVKLTPGDCLFIPSLWIHQVRSVHRNIAVNYWLDHQRAKNIEIDQQLCENVDPSKFLKLSEIVWPSLLNSIEHFRDYLFELFDRSQTNFRQWTKAFSRELNFDLYNNPKIINGFAQFFTLIDSNEDGHIGEEEIDTIFSSEKGSELFGMFQEILDEIDKIVEEEDTKKIKKNHDDL